MLLKEDKYRGNFLKVFSPCFVLGIFMVLLGIFAKLPSIFFYFSDVEIKLTKLSTTSECIFIVPSFV
jgi:hypothetical protein